MPRVSVIIPCYNQGLFLDDAVDSVLAQTFSDLEIIVVNDGSTEASTQRKLASYHRDKTRIVTTTNQGLAVARNNGIAEAGGDYILPLDADDRIEPRYIEEAVAILDNEPETGIVYCRARLFGAVEADWLLPEYSIEEMLRDNVIFCTALFRRSDWHLVGGYDVGMIHGWEDYEFWLSLIERGRGVKQLPGRYFHYRVSEDSMVRSKDKSQKVAMFKRIYQRHQALIGEHIEVWLEVLLEGRERYQTARLYIDCGAGVSDDSSMTRKVNRGRQRLSFTIASFADPRAVRFDPAECPVCLDLHEIALSDETDRHRIDVSRIGSNALSRHGNRFFFATDDPQLYLPVRKDELLRASALVIDLEITALGAEALQDIIAYQSIGEGDRADDRRWSSLLSWWKKGR